MEIHRFEKGWLLASLVLIVAFISTVAYGAVVPGVAMIDDSGGTVDPEDLSGTAFEDPGVRDNGDGTYDVYVVARQFAFSPGTEDPIRVPAGSTVTFHVTSSDVIHGFNLVGTNVNTMVIPGQVATMTVEFDEPATYGIVCHEYCGSGHHAMEGSLEVVPPEEFDGSGGGESA